MARKSKEDLKVLEQATGVLLSIVGALVALMKKRGISLKSVARLARPEGEALLEKIADAVEAVFSSAVSVAKVLIDMARAWVPQNFTLEKNTAEGELSVERIGDHLYVDGRKVVLYLSEKQKNGGVIGGGDLERELEGKSGLGTALLRYLLDNPALIPDSWKGKYLYFWATKLRTSGGNRCVLYLYWYRGQWQWCYGWLDGGWGGELPALLLEELQASIA